MHLAPPLEVTPVWVLARSSASESYRVPVLSRGVVCVILRLPVSVEHRLVTDRRQAYTAIAWRRAIKTNTLRRSGGKSAAVYDGKDLWSRWFLKSGVKRDSDGRRGTWIDRKWHVRDKSRIYIVSQKTSHLWLAIISTYTIRLLYFWQTCYCESKKSDDALFSHLTYLMLLHYLAK